MKRFCEGVMEWFGEMIPVFLVLGGGFFLFIILPFLFYGLYLESKSPTFTLKKDEWTITHSHTEPVTTYIMSGKVMIPITTWKEIPDQYNRVEK